MLPRIYRLTRSDDYAHVRRTGRSRAHPLLILASTARGRDETIRVGFTVSKKIGPAVVRNRVKRLLREAIRARLSTLRPGYDIVIIARQESVGARLDELGAALDLLLRQANLLKQTTEGGRDGI